MIDSKYNALSEQGTKGEKYFQLRHNELLEKPARIVDTNVLNWKIEGFDLGVERLEQKPLNAPALLRMIGVSRFQGYSMKLYYGGAEVKTVGYDQYLSRYGYGIAQEGVLGFPLWMGTEDLPDGKTKYLRSSHGALRRWMEPTVAKRGAHPIMLVYLLETLVADNKTGLHNTSYFASIAFEKVDVLFERLKEYARSHGLDLEHWDTSVPVNDLAFKIDGLVFQGNMWYVPITLIADLATVTMIGDDPSFHCLNKCSLEVQKIRLNYLKRLANGRWIPEERPQGTLTDDELLCQWEAIPFLTPPRYVGTLDRNGNPL